MGRHARRPAVQSPADPPWMEKAFQLAVQCQCHGLTEQAQQLYARILLVCPTHASALHNLGIVANQAQDLRMAVELFERAVAVQPQNADFHASLAAALMSTGALERAKAEFDAALRLNPGCVEALFNSARLLEDEGNLGEAAARLHALLQIQSNHLEALTRLGRLYCSPQFDVLAGADPARVAALYRAGNLHQLQGALGEAIVCFEKALALDPRHADARNDLGNAYLSAGRVSDASVCFEQGIRENPAAAVLYANLANVCREQGDLVRAETLLRRAIELDPAHPLMRINLANVLLDANRVSASIEVLEETIALAPSLADAHCVLGAALARQGRFEEVGACAQRALTLESKSEQAHQMALFMLHYSPKLDPQQLAAAHRQWAERFADPLFPASRRHWNTPDPERTLRIGYVSADFHNHPVAYFIDPVLAARDRNQTEVICYAKGKVDEWTGRIRGNGPGWRQTDRLGDAELAQLIEDDRIDILVDLSGFTRGHRLATFARKPAPVQVSWLGYFNTTGMRAMDYLIVDAQLAPPEEAAPFVEEPLRLPGGYLTYQWPSYAPAVAPAPCLRQGHITFGCFNALSKVGFHVVESWAEILRRTPGARLVMKNFTFADQGSRELYREQFERNGIASDRVDLLGPSGHAELLGSYAGVDIALDPFPYNGGTTTCEALAMGVPVISVRGDRFVSRVGATILHHAGLGALIAQNETEYIEKAVGLAAQPERVAEMRAGMRARLASSTLCDSVGFTRNLENAYRQIWRRWCALQKGR